MQGVTEHAAVAVIRERERAIQHALNGAGADDYVVIAGKGHEDYQEVQGQRYPFSDKAVVQQWLIHANDDRRRPH